jgi:hypothetical protein
MSNIKMNVVVKYIFVCLLTKFIAAPQTPKIGGYLVKHKNSDIQCEGDVAGYQVYASDFCFRNFAGTEV